MSRKRRTHLRGKRGQTFADKIRGIPLDRILRVSIDVHKYFHVVMIHNALGEIVTPTFEIDIFQTGFDQLCQAVDKATVRVKAQVVLTGMEPTSHYFENLARHLITRTARNLRKGHSFSRRQTIWTILSNNPTRKCALCVAWKTPLGSSCSFTRTATIG